MIGVLADVKGPAIDWAGLSPLVALFGGAVVVLLVGLLSSAGARTRVVPALTLGALGAAIGLTIWQWGEGKSVVSGALRVDDLGLGLGMLCLVAGAASVLLSLRSRTTEDAGHGDYHALLLSSIAGMLVLAEAQNLITLFLGLELLSISLYVLCASALRRETSLESGLKYLIVGSIGSATLLYGLALIYGATGSTDFAPIGRALSGGDVVTDPLLLTGIALVLAGLAFKASIAPFHQWTPDVYEGAPTPVTAFMAVATKAAAFAVILRLFGGALIAAESTWAPAMAALATVTIVVGNVGALGQASLKRMLAYSSVAQAGYMLVGVVVASRIGTEAVALYLAVYLPMNLAAFAVIVARERETPDGDDLRALEGIGPRRPWLAWPMTIAMLSLAGLPATAGFVGKVTLIRAAVDGGYAWLGVMIVVGSIISLAYYLRVVAAIWMRPLPVVAGRPAMAGGAPEADTPRRQPEVIAVAVVCAAASIGFGIIPSPLFDAARDAGGALGLL